MTEFIARKLTPEEEQAKREQIAKEDALVEKADLEAYRQFGFDPEDPFQADIIRKIIRIRKHMTTYDVFGHKLLETNIHIASNSALSGILEERHPTDDEIVSCSTYEQVSSVITITWQLDGGGKYWATWSTEMSCKDDDGWLVHTPTITAAAEEHGMDDPYEIETGDVYADMDCVYSAISISYMVDNKMFPWQKK